MGREVAGSCLDGVVMEMVSAYCGRFYAAKPELAAGRIEAIGFQVGHQLSERYTMDRPRFTDHLEAIKFICKDFWSELFKKQIDNLKTNHRGTFVLQDNCFPWLTHVSLDPSMESTGATESDSALLGDTAAQTTSMILYFPCGIIRGALTNLGIPCAVSADMSNLPALLDQETPLADGSASSACGQLSICHKTLASHDRRGCTSTASTTRFLLLPPLAEAHVAACGR